MIINRRNFIKNSLLASLFLGCRFSLGFPKKLFAASSSPKFVLHLVLEGGPDFRHFIVPEYSNTSGSYGYAYWSNRWNSHNLSNSISDWSSRWSDDFYSVSHNGTTFGILNKAGWLKEQFDAGNVAIVSNLYASTDRNHASSLLKFESGDTETDSLNLGRDGWGGRLASVLERNVLSMTNQVRLFCNGPHATNSKDHNNQWVISAKDSRNMGLAYPDALLTDPNSKQVSPVMARALRGYYDAKRDTVSEDSVYYKFFQHEASYREFGDQLNDRLASNPVPSEIEALYEGESTLDNTYFGRQIRNAYDCFVAQDILNFGIGSLEYGGWDSHKKQVEGIEPNIEDIFGTGKGLDTLTQALSTFNSDYYQNTIIVIGGEFGRQLASNGDKGTDHGKGNNYLVIGPQVNGGLYGSLFPDSEIDRYGESSADIEGLTSIERVIASVSDWVESGVSSLVVPSHASSDLEAGVSFSTLIS